MDPISSADDMLSSLTNNSSVQVRTPCILHSLFMLKQEQLESEFCDSLSKFGINDTQINLFKQGVRTNIQLFIWE